MIDIKNFAVENAMKRSVINVAEDYVRTLSDAFDDVFRKPTQAELDSRLQVAVLGDLPLYATQTLAKGADANTHFILSDERRAAHAFKYRAEKLTEGPTLLKIAADKQSTQIVTALLKAGADPNR